MADEKLDFVFDPTKILDGVKKVVHGLGDMAGAAMGVAKGMTGGGGDTAKAIAGLPLKIGFATAAMGMIFSKMQEGLSKALTFLPEVGQVFSVVGEIFMKNFLWPLRQLLIPLLQKLLNWARESRPMFVQMGVVLANAFRVVMTIVKMLWTFLQNFFKGFLDYYRTTFGSVAGGIEMLINNLMAKITIVATFLQITLGPIFTALGKGIGAMFDGITEGFKGWMPDIIKALGELGKAWDKVTKDMLGPESKGAWKDFGHILGTIVGGAVWLLVKAFQGLLEVIHLLQKAGLSVTDFFTAPTESRVNEARIKQIMEYKGVDRATAERMAKDEEEMMKRAREKHAKAKEAVPGGKVTPKVNDAFISKGGTVVPISDQDNVLAFKGAMPTARGGAGGAINISLGAITVNVTEGNAAKAGEDFAVSLRATLDKELRNLLYRQFELRAAV